MPQRIRFTGQQQADLEDFDLPSLKSGQVHVHVSYSLMSTGTEGIVYGRLFDPGTHWDNWVRYPFYPGYASIGTIVAVGDGVTDRKVGQTVAVRCGHATDCIVGAAQTMPVPDGVDPQDATWFALAKIASHGARAAGHWLGQSVAVVGAGPVGQMAVRWAAASGVRSLVVVDPAESRLAMAQAGGATAVISKPVGEAKDAVWAATPNGDGPDVVFEVTGHPAVFAPTLSLPNKFGKVVLLGDTGRPQAQHLTPDVVIRGITITGVHDSHNDEQWNELIAVDSFFQLVARGRFPLDGLITHRFKLADAPGAYAFAASHRSETMGVLFDWA